MASTPRTTALTTWFHANSGRLHPTIQIVEDAPSGVHYQASAPIDAGATLVSAPHSIALSYLNALVDDEFLVFRQCRDSFQIEAIGFFYLMAQYLNREHSFWKPYLDTLPRPEDILLQPLFFDDPDDAIWLEGTDVWHTVVARKAVYRKYYEEGISVLGRAGLDTREYSWHLFLWAATIFSSRSFASRSLQPERRSYWTTYKSTPDGQREAVILDMSRIPTEDLDFPVLFPGLDSANHSHSARVDWTFDTERFSISTNDGTEAGAEVFNNYGPKGNGELLIGYGFCVPDNPYDTVALTLKAPPTKLLSDLGRVQSDFFTADGDWSTEKTTFRLSRPPAPLSRLLDIFRHLPDALLELLVYIVRFERKLPFELVSITSSNVTETRYLPHIARMITQFLLQKLAQLQSVNLPAEPANRKQAQAAIYRHGQISVSQGVISSLKAFMRSLIWSPSVQNPEIPTRSCLVRLEHLIELLRSKEQLDTAFLGGIEASAGSKDLDVLRDAGWEEDLWVLLLCYLRLELAEHPARIMSEIPEYSSAADERLNVELLEQGETAMEIVLTAASLFPDSLWVDERWSAKYIAAVGGKMLRHDSFNVMCMEADGIERPRMFLYLHGAAA